MNKTQTYKYYKMCEKIAEKAGQEGEFLKAERWFLDAAKWRKIYRDNFCGGNWDTGHKARYDTCVGNAWIQREAYEDDKAIDHICYERGGSTTPKWSVWQKKHNNVMKDTFASLMEKHQKIKKARKQK
tara:strand:+ start:110 stop:493 length:384 start_codon:yes stop_codon:yes gene_type:complete